MATLDTTGCSSKHGLDAEPARPIAGDGVEEPGEREDGGGFCLWLTVGELLSQLCCRGTKAVYLCTM